MKIKMSEEKKVAFRRYCIIAMVFGIACFSLRMAAVDDELVEKNMFLQQASKQKNDEPLDQRVCSLAVVDCPDEVDKPEVRAEAMLAGTPMAGLGAMIVETANRYGVSWSLIIGIAEAESNRGKSYHVEYDKENCHNAWGIKPPSGQRDDGSYLRCYNDWQSGINTIAAVLSRRYKDQTPEQMCGVYCQPCNPDWIRNVRKFYEDVNKPVDKRIDNR